jgi:Glycosyl hydrolase family 26
LISKEYQTAAEARHAYIERLLKLVSRRSASGLASPKPGLVVAHNRNRVGTTLTQDINSAATEYGAFGGHKSIYWGTADTLTLSSEELTLVDAGHRFHLYTKVGLPWSTVTADNHDARLLALANTLKSRPGVEFWVNFHHEMEGELNSNGGTAGTHAQYIAMHQYCVDFLDAQNVTNAKYLWVITHSANKPNDLLLLWPGNGYVDIVGVQRYINCSMDATILGTRWLEDLQWFWDNYAAGTRNWRPKKSDGAGDVGFAFTEWGADVKTGPQCPAGSGIYRRPASERATAIDSVRLVLPSLNVWGVLEARFFDSDISDGTNWLEPKPSVDALAYQALKDAAA